MHSSQHVGHEASRIKIRNKLQLVDDSNVPIIEVEIRQLQLRYVPLFSITRLNPC